MDSRKISSLIKHEFVCDHIFIYMKMYNLESVILKDVLL